MANLGVNSSSAIMRAFGQTKKLLDEVATACKEDPKNTIGPDLGALDAPAGPALDARSR